MSARALPADPGADRPPAPSFAEAAGQVLLRQARSALRGKRALVAGVLAALPPLLAALIRSDDPIVLVRILVLLHCLLLLPVVAIALGSGLLYDEAEEGTLTYLFTAPVARGAIVLGKWAGALGMGWAILFLSLGATVLLTPAPPAAQAEATSAFVRASSVATALGFPAYLGLFTLLGVLWRHGFVGGLLYTFGYEFVVARIPAALKRLSVRYYVDSLVYPAAPDSKPFLAEFHEFPAATRDACVAALLGTALLSIFLAVLVARSKEFRARNFQA